MAMPIFLNTLGTAYTQDFNTLSNTPGTTTNDLTIIGWEMTEAGLGTRDNEQYAVDDGTSNTGDTYSYGTLGSPDRALGALQSGSLNATFGAVFFNSQPFMTIDSLTISYVGEQWRLGQAGRGPDRLDFQYSIGVMDVPNGPWTDFDALDFSTPNTAATAGGTDGNSAAFRTSISATITGVNFGPQMLLFLRWVDADIAGPEDALAIDDFSITTFGDLGEPPVNTVPGPQIVESDTDTAINGLSISDADAGSGVMRTKISVLHGTLSFAADGGATIDGNGSHAVLLQGTLDQINNALTTLDNLSYRGEPAFSGADTLTITTTDPGLLDARGEQCDTDLVTITVKPITGTNGDDTFTAQPGSQRIDALLGNDTITFDFRLVDATVKYEGNKVIIDGPSSHTVLTGFEKFVFTDGTVDNNDGNWLVDDLFYFSRNHDVWNAHADADRHYNTFGWHEGRDPNAFFSTAIYLSANPDMKAAGVNPLVHFDQSGWKEGRVPSLDFDPREIGKTTNEEEGTTSRIDHRLGQVALRREVGDRHGVLALRELLAALVHEHRQVGEHLGPAEAERVAEQEVLGRARHVVLAAHDVGDAHLGVVERVREQEHRHAGRPQEHEVLDRLVLEGHLAAHDVGEGGGAVVGHAEPERGGRRPARGRGRGSSRRSPAGRRAPWPAPGSPRWCSRTSRRARRRAGSAPPRGAPRGCRPGTRCRRPSRGRATAARRGCSRPARSSTARGRCPRRAGASRPPVRRASSQLNSAARALPTCR